MKIGIFALRIIAVHILLASEAGAVGGAFESIQELRNARSPESKAGADYIERGRLKDAVGDFAGAVAEYSKAISVDPKSPAHYYRACLLESMGRSREAIADLDVVLKNSPKSVWVYLLRANVHADLGNRKQAIADFDAAIENATNTTDGDLVRAQAFAAKGDYARAAVLYHSARRRGPRNENALNSFAWFSATCPQPSLRHGPEAVKAATKACELTKWKDAEVIDSLAAAYAESGDFTQAIKYQRQALAIRPPVWPDSLAEMQKRLRAY